MNQKAIYNVIDLIASARTWLDAAMYSSPNNVTNEQHERLHEAYDLLCQASDKLYNLPL